MQVTSFPAVGLVAMLLLVPIQPVLAADNQVSGSVNPLFPGVRAITLTEVGIYNDRSRGHDQPLLEFHTDTLNVKIRDPISTMSKREVREDELSDDSQLVDVYGALSRDGYVLTGVTNHQYEAVVSADMISSVPKTTLERHGLTRSVTDASAVTSNNRVTYYMFTNPLINTTRVVTTVQPIGPDGTPVGDRHVLVTPVFGDEGILGADDIGVYEPQPDNGAPSHGLRGGANERTPLLAGATTVTALTAAGAIVSGVALPVVAVAVVVFAVVSFTLFCIASVVYSVQTITIPADKRIREFTLVKETIGLGTSVPWHSHLIYTSDGSVTVRTPAPWWKQWNTKGSMVMYIPRIPPTRNERYSVAETRDIEAPSGSEFVFPTANSMTVTYKGKTILDAELECSHTAVGMNTSSSHQNRELIGNTSYKGYIEYAHQEHVNGITDFTAHWDVPTAPTLPREEKYNNSYIALWTGIGGNDGGVVVQPVLDWDHQETGKYWTIAAWAIRPDGQGDIACGPSGHSERKSVSVGHKIQGRLYYKDNKWNIEITDVTRGGTTKCSSNVVGISDVEVFGGVLEGRKLMYVGGDTNLPGSTTFYDMSYNTRVSLTGYVDPNAQEHFGGLDVEIVKNPSRVILHTANSR